jgi:hypothetical protein
MHLEDIEKSLEKGLQLGIKISTDNPDYLGWILVRKRHIPPVWDKKAYESEEEYIKKIELAEIATKFPYHIIYMELKKDVHEKGDYETENDYRKWVNHYLTSIFEVKATFERYGYKVEDLKPRWEIDAP